MLSLDGNEGDTMLPLRVNGVWGLSTCLAVLASTSSSISSIKAEAVKELLDEDLAPHRLIPELIRQCDAILHPSAASPSGDREMA